MLAWIFQRVTGRGEAIESAMGLVPAPGSLDLDGVNVSEEDRLTALLRVDDSEWRAEVQLIREYYTMFADRLPAELANQLDALEHRLDGASYPRPRCPASRGLARDGERPAASAATAAPLGCVPKSLS